MQKDIIKAEGHIAEAKAVQEPEPISWLMQSSPAPTLNLPNYIIVPSLASTASTCAYVLVLFTLYIMYVGYLAAYDIGYKPNFVMFVNMIFDVHDDTKNFEKYMDKFKCDTFVPSQTKAVEGMTTSSTKPISEKVSEAIKETRDTAFKYYNKMMLKMYTKGNRIKLFRP